MGDGSRGAGGQRLTGEGQEDRTPGRTEEQRCREMRKEGRIQSRRY